MIELDQQQILTSETSTILFNVLRRHYQMSSSNQKGPRRERLKNQGTDLMQVRKLNQQ